MSTTSPLISWFEIPVTDMARATAFYEAVLQVKLTAQGPMNIFPYPQQCNGGPAGSTGGALCLMDHMTPSRTGTLVYLFAGDDLRPALARVEASGGSVVMPRTLLSEEIGAIAIFCDSEGNHVGLHSMK